MTSLIAETHPWRSLNIGEGGWCGFAGSEGAAKTAAMSPDSSSGASVDQIARVLRSLSGTFAIVREDGERIIAAVDRTRSYPLFYCHRDGRFAVSNSARALREAFRLQEWDPLSVLEFGMSGYVTGRDTLFQGLKQLQAGEFLVWDKDGRELHLERYYRFYVEEKRWGKREDLIEELGAITDRAFLRAVEEAAGNPIWVPLSGGLDSRLVLCKLKELRYDALFAFSYGPPGNHEARVAKTVASRLGVPWRFVPSRWRASRAFFRSDLRRKYWEFADGLSTVPFMQDLDVLADLRRKGRVPGGSVIINGQSGDFISGGHIPSALLGERMSRRRLIEMIVDKHYSLWAPLKTPLLVKRVEEKIGRLLGWSDEMLPAPMAAKVYECWEWQERQSKYVVNGQRIYDYMELDWSLPLWDPELMDFWERIDPADRAGQNLFLDYLQRYDYQGLFRGFHPKIWRWPGATIGVVPLARAAGILMGESGKDLVYRYARFIGHYRNHYAGYGAGYFLRNISKARGEIAFSVDAWLRENSAPLEVRAPDGTPGTARVKMERVF